MPHQEDLSSILRSVISLRLVPFGICHIPHTLTSFISHHNGLQIIALEHRFYGESRPTKDLSTESLKFLTSQQALSDLAVFVEYIKDFNMNEKDLKSTPPLELRFSTTLSKVIVFGGSYPGNLAAWFKLKFPSLAIGSIASSAPVYAEGKYYFTRWKC